MTLDKINREGREPIDLLDEVAAMHNFRRESLSALEVSAEASRHG